MLYGEGVVLRLLDKERMKFDLRTVGMPPEVLNRFHDLISLPHGIVLVTGPTGSGKTTTLYAALNAIEARPLKSSPSRIPSSITPTASVRFRSTRRSA